MDLAYIQEHWCKKTFADIEASIRAWDSVAGDYESDKRVTFENDSFLQLMEEKIPFTKDMKTLDVGCGTGNYSLAIAPRVGQAVATDFSPKMLEGGARLAKKMGINNIAFLERDWFGCDGREFEGQYDLAFAHTTPAVSDYNTLRKLMKATRHYGMLCMPSRRTDEVFDALSEIVGKKPVRNTDAAAYTFDTLWGHGVNPEVTYRQTQWQNQKPLEKAYDWYLGRLSGSEPFTAAQMEAVRKYLEDISVDGMVSERTNTTLVTFFWEV